MTQNKELLKDLFTPFFDFYPVENSDWGFARNRQAVLMSPSTEWVQSIFSCTFEANGKKLVAPNRDFPYEGLLVYQDHENWKFLDMLAVGIQSPNGEYLPCMSDSSRPSVHVNPWCVTYDYRALDGQVQIPFSVSYYLHSINSAKLLSGAVEIIFPPDIAHQDRGLVVSLLPFIDIRHMYANATGAYQLKVTEPNKASVSNAGKNISFYFPEGWITAYDQELKVDWKYKLGTGSRREDFSSEIVFIPEEKAVTSLFEYSFSVKAEGNVVRFFLTCGPEQTYERMNYQALEKIHLDSLRQDLEEAQKIAEVCPVQQNVAVGKALQARVAGAKRFRIHSSSISQEDCLVPCAGAWWFKTPWFRDVFEGILNNFDTLIKFPRELAAIKKVVKLAVHEREPNTGRILNRFPEFKTEQRSYNSVDGTLLCYLTANKVMQAEPDLSFALEIWAGIRDFVDNALSKQPLGLEGPPRVDEETGLLLCVPQHSWIDTRNQGLHVGDRWAADLPNRLSESFIRAVYAVLEDKSEIQNRLTSPVIFLPEINAQWIVLLADTVNSMDKFLSQHEKRKKLVELRLELGVILEKAVAHFKPVFWNPDNGFLFNAVYEDLQIKDALECEAGVTATSLLGRAVFSEPDLISIFECAQKTLLVYRQATLLSQDCLPFGLATRNVPAETFLGDRQYHGNVVWLRSSPYWVRLLALLGKEKMVREILLNTLDHQVSEGAIFYNHELLSRPIGINPSPNPETSQNPVPVKNPIQFWSQWCDVFFENPLER